MNLNLANPGSIVRWHAVAPERHAEFLKWARKAWPNFKPAIDEAIKTIRRADRAHNLESTKP